MQRCTSFSPTSIAGQNFGYLDAPPLASGDGSRSDNHERIWSRSRLPFQVRRNHVHTRQIPQAPLRWHRPARRAPRRSSPPLRAGRSHCSPAFRQPARAFTTCNGLALVHPTCLSFPYAQCVRKSQRPRRARDQRPRLIYSEVVRWSTWLAAPETPRASAF